MNEQDILIECAVLDGILVIDEKGTKYNVYKTINGQRQCVMRTHALSYATAYFKPYTTSHDAILPLIRKRIDSEVLSERVANSTRFNYCLTNAMEQDNLHVLETYGFTWVVTILSTPLQLCRALLAYEKINQTVKP